MKRVTHTTQGRTTTAQHFLLRIALLAFIATQAIVPAGFMPSAFKDGIGFSYCPGDIKNQFVIKQLDSESQHAHHHHHFSESAVDQSTADQGSTSDLRSTSADDHCQFSLFSSLHSFEPGVEAQFVYIPVTHASRYLNRVQAPRPYFQPHNRAPPQFV